MSAARFAPIYTDRAGNRVAIVNANFLVEDPADLYRVRTDAFWVTCGVGLTWTRDALDIDAETPHFRTKLWMFDVALLAGPDFDRFCAEDGVAATPEARDG